jgi:glycosyltransferase involved in cell wall biosynthesis
VRVLVLEGDIYNSITGFRKNLVNELRKEHEVYVAGSFAYEWQETDILDNDKKIILLGKLQSNPVKSIVYLYRLLLLLYKVKPDYCMSFNLRPNLFLSLVSLVIKVRGIATITGTGFMFESEGLKVAVLRILYRFLLGRFEAVFIQNQSDCDQFLSHGFRFKSYKVIPGSGVDVELFSPSTHIFRDKGYARFIFIARLIKDKGFFEYVEAAEKIKQDKPDAQFFVLGSFYSGGHKSSEIDKQTVSKLHNKGIITYLGTSKNVIPFVEDMDCVVLPSYREGLSNTLMEGASLAKPLITTDVPGCRELVDDAKNGFLCKVKSPHDLEVKMRMFIDLPIDARKEMGRLGREKMVLSFNRKNVILEYTRFIETLKY